MTIFYHFLSSRNAITNLERKMIKVSRIKTVNDVFELQPYLRFRDKDKRHDFKKIRKKVASTYGMVCFSSNWQEPIMWGHYADCNKGIVLGFEFVSNKYIIKEVQYPSDRKKISLDSKKITPEEYIDAVGYIKYEGWSYEKEHRFFVALDDCTCIEGNYFLEFGNDLKLKEVIIGPEHPSKDKKNYSKTARYIITQLSGFAVKRIELFFDIPKPVIAASRAALCDIANYGTNFPKNGVTHLPPSRS